ncbi:MAG: prepilin-type cleavage/methylation domain-containing protein [Betaproteobacteria bacterium]|nr:prepilin-type cleavage/methylation domain-containing protein [Betaproteobacteria bacterium]
MVEIAIVLLIVGLALGGLLLPLNTQLDLQRVSETNRTLSEVKDALIGYALANGRLPCPASSASNGAESFAGGGNASNGNCSNFYDGFLPAATLGITPTDQQGYALDGWDNRIRYAVTNSNSNAFSKTDGMKATGMGSLAPDLYVCASGNGINPGTNCGSAVSLTTQAPLVIYSIGKNGPTGGTGTDEGANPNPNGGTADRVYVSHEQTVASAPNGEFDDIVTWISANILYSRMVAAGKLP